MIWFMIGNQMIWGQMIELLDHRVITELTHLTSGVFSILTCHAMTSTLTGRGHGMGVNLGDPALLFSVQNLIVYNYKN